MIILKFKVNNVVFEQKYFHLSKLAVLYSNNSNGTMDILLIFVLDQIILLDFTGIKSLNCKEIRVSRKNLFWGV